MSSILEDPVNLMNFADALVGVCSRRNERAHDQEETDQRHAEACKATWRFVEAARTYWLTYGLSDEQEEAHAHALASVVHALAKSRHHAEAMKLFRHAHQQMEWDAGEVSTEMLRAALVAAAGVPNMQEAMELLRLLQARDAATVKEMGKAMETALNANEMKTARALMLELCSSGMVDEYICAAALSLARSNEQPSEVLRLWDQVCAQPGGPPQKSAPIRMNIVRAHIDIGTDSSFKAAREEIGEHVDIHGPTLTSKTALSLLAAIMRINDIHFFFKILYEISDANHRLRDTPQLWNGAMSLLHEEKMPKATRAVFNHMRNNTSTIPDSMSYSLMLSACGHAVWGRTAERVAEEAYNNRVPLNGHGMKGAFRAIGFYMDCSHALEVHRKLASIGSEMAEPALLSCLVTCKECEDPDVAEEIFEDYGRAGCRNNTNLWSTFISTFQTRRMADKAMGYLKQMRNEGFAPTVVTYSALLAAFTAEGRFDDAIEVARMGRRQDGVEYNTVSFKNSVASACKRVPDMDGVMRLAEAFQEEFGVILTPSIASEILHAFAIAGRSYEGVAYAASLINKGFISPPTDENKQVLANAILTNALCLPNDLDVQEELLKASWEERVDMLRVGELNSRLDTLDKADVVAVSKTHWDMNDSELQRIGGSIKPDDVSLKANDSQVMAGFTWLVALAQCGAAVGPRNFTHMLGALSEDCSSEALDRVSLAIESLADTFNFKIDSIYFRAAIERAVERSSLDVAQRMAYRLQEVRQLPIGKRFAGRLAVLLANNATGDPEVPTDGLGVDYAQQAESFLRMLLRRGIAPSKNMSESLARIQHMLGKHASAVQAYKRMREKEIYASRVGAEAAFQSALNLHDLEVASDALLEANNASRGMRGDLEEHVPEAGWLNMSEGFAWLLYAALESKGNGERAAERLVVMRHELGIAPPVVSSMRVAKEFATVEHNRQLAVLSALNRGLSSNGARAAQLLLSLAAMHNEQREDAVSAVQAALAVRPEIVDDAVWEYCEDDIGIRDEVLSQRANIFRAATEAMLEEEQQALKQQQSAVGTDTGSDDGSAALDAGGEEEGEGKDAIDHLMPNDELMHEQLASA